MTPTPHFGPDPFGLGQAQDLDGPLATASRRPGPEYFNTFRPSVRSLFLLCYGPARPAPAFDAGRRRAGRSNAKAASPQGGQVVRPRPGSPPPACRRLSLRAAFRQPKRGIAAGVLAVVGSWFTATTPHSGQGHHHGPGERVRRCRGTKTQHLGSREGCTDTWNIARIFITVRRWTRI